LFLFDFLFSELISFAKLEST